jgi:hypothetical protein
MSEYPLNVYLYRWLLSASLTFFVVSKSNLKVLTVETPICTVLELRDKRNYKRSNPKSIAESELLTIAF